MNTYPADPGLLSENDIEGLIRHALSTTNAVDLRRVIRVLITDRRALQAQQTLAQHKMPALNTGWGGLFSRNLRKRLAQQSEELVAQGRRIMALQTQLQTTTEQYQKTERQLAIAKQRMQQFTATEAKARQFAADLQMHKQRLQALNAQRAADQRDLTAFADRVQSLTEHIQRLESVASSSGDEIARKNLEIEQLNDLLHALRETNDGLEKELAEVRNAYEGARKTMSSQVILISDKDREIGSLSARNRLLSEELEAAREHTRSLKRQVREAVTGRDRLQQALKSVHSQKTGLVGQYKEVLLEREMLRKDLHHAGAKTAAFVEQIHAEITQRLAADHPLRAEFASVQANDPQEILTMVQMIMDEFAHLYKHAVAPTNSAPEDDMGWTPHVVSGGL